MFFDVCCKMSTFICFQCEKRIQDAFGLFYSGPIGFYINEPRKTVNPRMSAVLGTIVFIFATFFLSRFTGKLTLSLNVVAEELTFPYKLHIPFWPQLTCIDTGSSLKLAKFSSW